MKKLLILIAPAILLLSACSAYAPPQSSGKIHGHADISKGEIAPAAVFEKMEKGEKLVILDVREADEYEEVRIAGTTHRISLKELSEASLIKAGIKKDDQIIVYCRSGTRSRTAAVLMRTLGYTNVWEINSGIIHWMEDGFPTESGKANAEAGSQQSAIGDKGAQTDTPKISFDRLSHDFGEIPQFGGNVETKFTVKNEGKSALEIGAITTSCSCTSAKLDKSKIPANGSAILTIIFNPNLHEEPKEKFKRTIFIPTNDPEKPEAELEIWVDILEGK